MSLFTSEYLALPTQIVYKEYISRCNRYFMVDDGYHYPFNSLDICSMQAVRGNLNYFSLLRTRGRSTSELVEGNCRPVHDLQTQLGCEVLGNERSLASAVEYYTSNQSAPCVVAQPCLETSASTPRCLYHNRLAICSLQTLELWLKCRP